MEMTVSELSRLISKRGFTVQPSTIRAYAKAGLLPMPNKSGVHKGGVRHLFRDGEAALAQLERVCVLKEDGYTVSRILKLLEQEERQAIRVQIQEQLGRFIEKDGCFLCRINIDPLPSSYRAADSLSSFSAILEKESERPPFGGIAFRKTTISQIEQRGLFKPLHTHHGQFAFEVSGPEFEALRAWGWLRNVLEIDWDVLEALHERHRQALQRYIVLPEPDGTVTTAEFNGWQKQRLQNAFSRLLKEYALEMRTDTATGLSEVDADSISSRYDSIEDCVRGYLSGECAFVPIMTLNPLEPAPSELVWRFALRRF
jgi:DNA-binding transcriptional MerR regulator